MFLWTKNDVNPDEIVPIVIAHLGLHCLQSVILGTVNLTDFNPFVYS